MFFLIELSSGTAVSTINTSGGTGTALYEPKESPAEPTRSQKDASYKKPIDKPSWLWVGVLAALVITMALLEIIIYAVVVQAALKKFMALLEILITVAVLVTLVLTVAALYKKRKTLYQNNGSDAQQSIPLVQGKIIFVIFKLGAFGF